MFAPDILCYGRISVLGELPSSSSYHAHQANGMIGRAMQLVPICEVQADSVLQIVNGAVWRAVGFQAR